MKKSKIIISVIIALVLVIIVAAACFITMGGGGPFSGVVTNSVTGEPIEGVCVSDGRNVVKTDANGSYELEGWRKSRFITVTVPAGYTSEDFYIPVENSGAGYDFSLEPSELTAAAEHCFVQISDTEIGENGTGEWLDFVRQTAEDSNAAFIIHTGDICYEDGLKRHIKDMNTDSMGRTVRYIIGNHDYVDGKYGEELYESIYGPVWYSFDVGNVHYVVTPFQTGGDYKSGYSESDRWKWLKNDLENVDGDKKVVMFNHTKSPSEDYVIKYSNETLDLKAHNLIAWIFGHYHYNTVYENEGVLNVSAPRPDCGGIDSSVGGTRIINISKDGEITTDTAYYILDAYENTGDAEWSTQLDANVLFCDTVSDGENIYTATVDDDFPGRCGVYCLDKKNGEIEWFCQTQNSVKNNVALSDSKIVAVDVQGNAYCISAADGNILWSTTVKLGETVGTSSAPVIFDGVIYCGTARTVTALSLDTGEVIWENNRNKGENSPAEFTVIANKLIVNSHWDSLCALDISNGKELWSNDDEDIRFRSSTPLALDDKTLIVADSNAVMTVNLENGDIINKTDLEEYNFSSSAMPASDGKRAYIPCSDGGIIAYDIESGTVLWNYETRENIIFTAPYTGKGSRSVESSPILADGRLIFGANDGYIYTLNAENGELISEFNVGSGVLGKLTVDDNEIYAATFDGRVICIEQ